MTLKSLLIWASVLLAGCTQLWAQEVAFNKLCESRSNIAENIMKMRQRNWDMAEVMNIGSGDPFHEKLVIEAYKIPRYESEENIRNVIQDFKNADYLDCIQSFQAAQDEQSE